MELSVVVPVHGCEGCLRELHRRLSDVLPTHVDSYELVFVDDRGPDASWSVLKELAIADPHVQLLRLSRNFGQHAAITAGLMECDGDRVVVMDCDLQNRPEDIPLLLAAAREGNDIVFTRREARETTLFRRFAAGAYYRIRNVLMRTKIDTDHGSMTLISRAVVDAFKQVQDRDRQFILILYWLGFDSATVDLPHDERYAGQSSYTLRSLLHVAADGMFFQTTVLLRWIVYLGFVFAALGVGFAAWAIYSSLSGNSYPGWTSLAVLNLVVGGFIITSTGVTGLYIGKIFEQVKQRPLYVIEQRWPVASETPEDPDAASERSELEHYR